MFNGKLYIGSAYGNDCLLNRWSSYVNNLTGRNVELKKVLEEKGEKYIQTNFKYSILEIFDKSIKNIDLGNNKKLEEKKLNLNNFKIENFKHKCYEYDYYEDNEKTYSISCGILTEGYLLIINFYSASKEEVENAIKYIYSVEKIN